MCQSQGPTNWTSPVMLEVHSWFQAHDDSQSSLISNVTVFADAAVNSDIRQYCVGSHGLLPSVQSWCSCSLAHRTQEGHPFCSHIQPDISTHFQPHTQTDTRLHTRTKKRKKKKNKLHLFCLSTHTINLQLLVPISSHVSAP